MTTKLHLAIAAAALAFGAGSALAQHDNHDAPATQPKHLDERSGHRDQPAPAAKPAERVGDPYSLDTCPTSGKKLGSMGDPVAKVYDGREVRFCCPDCPPKFEKDLAANLAKLDEKIIKDQGPLYPLKTSVVTGKDLPAKPYEFVYGNRLVRLGAESEKTSFVNHAEKFMGDLDRAVVAMQDKDYPLKTCPVSKDELGGGMGKPVDLVVAGRLVRLCCKDCKKDIEKDPAKFIAIVDAARRGDKPKPEADHDKKDGHDEHRHGG